MPRWLGLNVESCGDDDTYRTVSYFCVREGDFAGPGRIKNAPERQRDPCIAERLLLH